MDEKTLNIYKKKLNSGKINEIYDALKFIKSNGATNLIPYALELLNNIPNVEIEQYIYSIIRDVKEQSSAKHIIAFLSNNQNIDILYNTLSNCWQSTIDYSKYLPELVDLFLNYEFKVAFEAFTVIDVCDGNFEKKIAEEQIHKLKNNIPCKIEQKNDLIVTLIHKLESNIE